MNFTKKLEAIWNAKTGFPGEKLDLTGHRYYPKSLDGGTGWGVWDDLDKRFLSDRAVKKMPLEKLLNEMIAN